MTALVVLLFVIGTARQDQSPRLDFWAPVCVSADPTGRLIGSPKRWARGAALTSTLHWFETDLLTRRENLVGLRVVNREVLAQAEMATRVDRIVLDMDSSSRGRGVR